MNAVSSSSDMDYRVEGLHEWRAGLLPKAAQRRLLHGGRPAFLPHLHPSRPSCSWLFV